MKRFFLLLSLCSIAYAQQIQYDYNLKIYPVKNSASQTSSPQNVEKVGFSKENSLNRKSNNIQETSTKLLENQVINNVQDKELRALLLKILKEIEENRKLIQNIKGTSCNEERIIKKLSRIIQDKLYLSRKYTYAYIRRVLEEYQKQIQEILEENNENLKRDIETKLLQTKNDLSSLISQASSDIKDSVDSIKTNIDQVSNKLDDISQTQEALKEDIDNNFAFIKYLLFGISFVIIVGFIFLGIKMNKSKDEKEEE